LALLQAAQSDDRRAMDELLRRYEPLVRAVVARVRAPYGCDREELAQDARLGLLGAIRAWEPDRGPFGAFAATCARGQVIKALDRAGARKHQLLSRAVSLDPASSRWAAGDPAGEVSRASLYDVIPSNSRLGQPVAMLLAREQLDRVLTARPTAAEVPPQPPRASAISAPLRPAADRSARGDMGLFSSLSGCPRSA